MAIQVRGAQLYLLAAVAATGFLLKGLTFEQFGLWVFWLYFLVEAVQLRPSHDHPLTVAGNRVRTEARALRSRLGRTRC